MVFEGSGEAGREAGIRDGVLRRLLAARNQAEAGAGRAPQLPQPSPATPGRAAATAVGRAADRLYHLGVQPVSVTPGALTLAELPELLPSLALLVVLQGPGDLVGMIALCAETVVALTEIQTLGRITSRAADRRRLTRSDAMICADFVNALMVELSSEMSGLDGFEGVSGYRYATWLDDPRPLALMLEDRPYRSIDFDLRLGGAETRECRMLVALPQPAGQDRTAVRPAPGVAQRPAAGEGGPSSGEAQGGSSQPAAAAPADPLIATQALSPTLACAMQSAPVELVGVLCRRRMSLSELRGLTAGRLLALPRVSLNEARIETSEGQLLATGKFGEAEGCHAIRLRDPHAGDSALSGGSDLPDPSGAAPLGVVEPPIGDLAQPDAFRDGAASLRDDGTEPSELPSARPPKTVGRA